jgi:tRNA(Ile)-lysidine synthase
LNRIGAAQIPENDPLLKAVRATVRKAGMLRPGDGVLVGVSGGRDSAALMAVLVALAPAMRLRLGVAHFHHGLRGTAADQDARLVEQQAIRAGFPFYYAKGDVGAHRWVHRQGIEEAARDLRYAFFEVTALRHGFARIALGHHADDNAELVLMRLLRGSGPLGLSGMPSWRPCGTGELTIIRPLIDTDRAAIDRFCRRQGLATREDASNRALQFTRNRIRHDLLPRLRADYNPSIAAGLNRLAGLMRDEEDWLETLVADRLDALTVAVDADQIILDAAALGRIHPAEQRRVLRAALRRIRGDLRRVGFELLEALRRLVDTARGPCAVDLPDDLRAERWSDRLHIGPPRPGVPPPAFSYTMNATGRLHIAATGARLVLERLAHVDRGALRDAGQYVAYFDMDQIVFPITIRSFRPGDRFAPFGLQGTQKLKKYFIDHKIPRAERPRFPLVVSGGEIIWIAGLRRSSRAPVGARSTNILKVELLVA